MAFDFILKNSSSESVTAKLYDWNDLTWGIAYKSYEVPPNKEVRCHAADNVVMQIGLWTKDKKPCNPLTRKGFNFYSTKRDWTVVHEDGYWDIVKTRPGV